ncbi:hypothetical protein SDC9_83949 [bioreactor metagenome]|uniref:Uncharacterized protein n=1 Tax=bioreactor metagenome TaxID=1076179 RepID=A0A644Z9I6_9ZZZZ|nr:hypothetical protein [Oscillospiraceae bacterium]
MYFRQLKHSIFNLVEFIIIVAIVLAVVVVTDFISIRIQFNFLTVAAIVVIGVWLMSLAYNIIRIGISVLLDLICKSFIEVELQFMEQYPFKSSFLTERTKYEKDGEIKRVNRLDFKIVAKHKEALFVLTSETYYLLDKNVRYIFTIGKHSQFIVNVRDENGHPVSTT